MRLCFLVLFFFTGGCLDGAPPGMVKIDGGTFPMGTDKVDKEKHALSIGLEKPWYADEFPEHRQIVQSFYMDRFEVTNREFYIFAQATDRLTPSHWGGPKYLEGTGDLPVTNVTFFDAAAYADWVGKRLPTEAEWERAARGPKNLIYPWGNKFDFKAANISRSAGKKKGQGLKPVGNYPAGVSAYGVEDMIGNAWEWVWDYYQPYPGNEWGSSDYGKKYIVVKGLSFYGLGHFGAKDYAKAVALKARSGYRAKLPPLARKIDVGFRCAKSLEPLTKRIFDEFVR